MNLQGAKAAQSASVAKQKDRMITLIVWFKYFHCLLFIAIALGARHMVNKDLGDFLEHLADAFRVDPNNRYLESLLAKAQLTTAKQLRELSFGSFFYAAVVCTEATGLALRKRWAEYFTIIVTASFLPLEVYELIRRVTAIKISVMIINLLILGYLIVRVIQTRKTKSVKTSRDSQESTDP
jgi:uncharacterized membrane protein (DUF2068 family)